MLANIYLNYLDTIWEKKFLHLGALVRYADDLVILCKTQTHALEAIHVLKAVCGKLELEMNTAKSRLVNLTNDQAGFDFLGMHHKKVGVKGKYGLFYSLRSYPSQKAMRSMRGKIKEVTAPRNRLYWSMGKMVAELNPMIRGWRNYYRLDPFSGNILRKIDVYVRVRLTLFWNKKHRKRNKHGEMRVIARIAKWSGLQRVAIG
nr:group II intron maturase-specific domain-containing protein [Cohnella fermenti]